MKRWFGLILIVLAITLFVGKNRLDLTRPINTLSTDFAYDNSVFLPAVSLKRESRQTALHLVVPHHLLASSLIADGIYSLSPQLDTVVILSPNHSESGACDIITTATPWNTPFGTVDTNLQIVDSLVSSGLACLDDTSLSSEHGVATLIPFIKYFHPQIKVVSLIFKRFTPTDRLDNVSTLLGKYSGTGIIASLDFSHGLSQNESWQKDRLTQNLIESHSYSGIYTLSSEFVDSPSSLITFLKISAAKNISLSIITHTDSSFFNQVPDRVTSYFLISGHVKEESLPSPDLKNITIIFTGDVMLGRSVNSRIHRYQNFSWPFQNLADLLSSADITVINLESPFGQNCPLTDTGMIFCADQRSVRGLTDSGVDVAGVANNHIGNQGQEGYLLTLDILKQNHIDAAGTGSAVIREVSGTKFAFLAFNDIAPVYNPSQNTSTANLTAKISQAKKISDVVITLFHWGGEYQPKNSRQTALAKLAIDSGADVVVGHHPHWIQSNEMYRDKPIYYSLGNLVFDQMWSRETKEGLILKLHYSSSKLLNQETIKVDILDYGQPKLR